LDTHRSHQQPKPWPLVVNKTVRFLMKDDSLVTVATMHPAIEIHIQPRHTEGPTVKERLNQSAWYFSKHATSDRGNSTRSGGISWQVHSSSSSWHCQAPPLYNGSNARE